MKPANASSLPLIDRDQLIERMMGNVEMAERMLQKFLSSCEHEADVLETTVRMGNKTEIASLAHRFKGTARTMSAPRIAALAAELEQRSQNDSTSELLDLVDQIRESHQELRAAADAAREDSDATVADTSDRGEAT